MRPLILSLVLTGLCLPASAQLFPPGVMLTRSGNPAPSMSVVPDEIARIAPSAGPAEPAAAPATGAPSGAAPSPAAEAPVPPVQQINQPITLSDPLASMEMLEGTTRHEIPSGTGKRGFLIHAPKTMPSRLTSLVFSFHPEGMSAADYERLTGFSTLSDQEGFIVVYPEGTGERPTWNTKPDAAGDSDLRFVNDMVTYVTSRYPVSRNSIYASGLGAGAQLSARIACAFPELFAAVAVVGGNYTQWSNCVSRPLSVLVMHGMKDEVMPYGGRSLTMGAQGYAERMANFNRCGAGAPTTVMEKDDTTAIGWGGCAAKTEVLMFSFRDMGHNWPGSTAVAADQTTHTIDGASVIWRFFATHPQARYRAPRSRNP